MAEREIHFKLTADVNEYIASIKAAQRATKRLGWFESRTRRALMAYLYGSLIFMGALLVFTLGMGIWALATI